MIADTAVQASLFLQAGSYSYDYPIYYLGKITDTIKIGKMYWRGRTPWINDFRRPQSRKYSDKTLSIFVDTSIKTNSPVEYFSNKLKIARNSTLNCHSFLFSISNISDSPIYLGRTFALFFIHREARDKNGNWVKLDKKLDEGSLCTTGHPYIILRQEEIVISKLKRYAGSFVTDFRLVFGYDNNIIYSNIFRDSIDERALDHAERLNNR